VVKSVYSVYALSSAKQDESPEISPTCQPLLSSKVFVTHSRLSTMGPHLGDTVTSGIDSWQDLGVFWNLCLKLAR